MHTLRSLVRSPVAVLTVAACALSSAAVSYSMLTGTLQLPVKSDASWLRATAGNTGSAVETVLRHIRDLALAAAETAADDEDQASIDAEFGLFNRELDALALAIDTFDAAITEHEHIPGPMTEAMQDAEEEYLDVLFTIQEQTEDAVFDAVESGDYAELVQRVKENAKENADAVKSLLRTAVSARAGARFSLRLPSWVSRIAAGE